MDQRPHRLFRLPAFGIIQCKGIPRFFRSILFGDKFLVIECFRTEKLSIVLSNATCKGKLFLLCRIFALPGSIKDRAASLREHLRDSVRTNRTLQHHLSREALPHIGNYHIHPDAYGTGHHGHMVSSGSRPTLEELYLGEKPVCKVRFWV